VVMAEFLVAGALLFFGGALRGFFSISRNP
jgi:hypothetical protein